MSTKPNSTPEGLAPEGEEATQIDDIANLTAELLNERYASKNKPTLRGVHPKSHGCVRAYFKINEGIPANLQVGLFSTPGKEHQALIRFSNATARIDHDLKDGQNGSRGMALKVLDVEQGGTFLQDDHGARNQDFLMINTPAFAFTNVPDYLRLTQVQRENDDEVGNFFAPLNPAVPGFTPEERARTKQSLDIVTEIGSLPVANPLGVQYFGAAPFLFGDACVMRFSVRPRGGAEPQTLPDNPSEDYLKEALIERMKDSADLVFDFMVQVRARDENSLELEDATARWDEAEFPFVTIAAIGIPSPQLDITTPKHEAACEKLVYTPWHSLAAHEPLGGINRLRKRVYSTSANARLNDNAFIVSLSKSGDRGGWLGMDSDGWVTLVSDESEALTLELYPYDNVDYYRIKGTGQYLSVSDNDYVGFYNWFGATGWTRQGRYLVSDYNGHPLSFNPDEAPAIFAWGGFYILDVTFD
ncbi:MAG: hypothetical protein COA42_13435 [Alteromonadaceae bacterium]|nr:MAG: hypothetical protein COA42_13435 [Alteromonadaceae bacterium]